MCDYSLEAVTNRPAMVGDVLTLQMFMGHTKGFAASNATDIAVCLKAGTRVAVTIRNPRAVAGRRLSHEETASETVSAIFVQPQRKAQQQRDSLMFTQDSAFLNLASGATKFLHQLPEGLTVKIVSIDSVADRAPDEELPVSAAREPVLT